ncbi:UvrD-helicase domain-containing protein [Peptostreptococcus stomatis]
MATKWTKEQASVIDHRGSNLLVAAAAGSGKTAVLIERIISLVTDKEKPIDIDKLLVVTFTKAAANEMRERVGLALEDALDKDPENDHLQRQLLLLNRADITTIDSFCGRVVRENFHATDLDPNVRTGDPAEIEMIKKDVIEDLFEDLYNEKNEEFLSLVDIYSARNNDRPLMDLILMLNTFIDSSAYPEDWLDDNAEKFNTKDKEDKDIISSYLGPYLTNEVAILASYAYRLEEVIDKLEAYDDLVKYRDFIGQHLVYIRSILGVLSSRLGQEKTSFDPKLDANFLDLDLEDLKEKIGNYRSGKSDIKSFRIGSKVDDYVKAEYKIIKKMVDSIISDIKSIQDRIYISLDEVRLELDMAYPYMRAVSNITKRFRQAYRQKLKSLGLVDFSYITHTALDILIDRSGGSLEPSKIALAYRDLYEEVFIDEYQDSNMVQELILSTISRTSPGNRFMVGDVKQSIYRFRQAMPEIFMKKYDEYAISQGPIEAGRKILLYNNFRSSAQVLEACNHVFMSIMRKATGELDYTDEERLNPSAVFKELDYDSIDESVYRDLGNDSDNTGITPGLSMENFNIGGPVEVRLVDKVFKEDGLDLEGVDLEDFRSMSSFRSQCQAIGVYIDQVVNNREKPYLVFDRKLDKYRKIEYRDIVVLFRSLKSRVEDIEDVFSQLGIPIYSDLGGDYFSTLEVSIFENLLRIIDNPRQDICLLSVMRSPIYKFKPSDFALLRLLDKDSDIYGLLVKLYEMDQDELDNLDQDYKDLRARLVYFMDQIKAYRKMSSLMPLDEFIWFLLKDTGYYAYVGGLELGQHRQNNLILFFERARTFEKTSFKGLFNFVNYIDRVKTRGSDLGEAKELSGDANVVRLMTIHKSKGLEFPLVIVAKADGKFNFKSSDHRLSLHQDLGYGPKIIDKSKRINFPSMAKTYIDKKMELEQEAEEMRLLYVAMTRAKEKLVFFANIDDYSKKLDEWKSKLRDQDGRIESFEILNSRTYLDWIMMSIANLEVRGKALDARGKECDYMGYKDTNWLIDVEDKLAVFKRVKDIENRVEPIRNMPLEPVEEEKDPGRKPRIVKPYAYQASALKPASISVSEVKKIIESEDQTKYENMYMSRTIPDLKTPSFMHTSKTKISYSPGEKGTIFHLVMELLDFEGLYRLREDTKGLNDKIGADLQGLIDKNILRPEEVGTVNRKWIADFVKTPMFARLSQAASHGLLHRETAIDYNIGLSEIYKDESIDESERMMLVGIVDVFFEDQDGDLVLLDYKTDYVKKDRYEDIVARYKPQLDLYARALEDISGKRVKEKYIYLFSVGDLVSYD